MEWDKDNDANYAINWRQQCIESGLSRTLKSKGDGAMIQMDVDKSNLIDEMASFIVSSLPEDLVRKTITQVVDDALEESSGFAIYDGGDLRKKRVQVLVISIWENVFKKIEVLEDVNPPKKKKD